MVLSEAQKQALKKYSQSNKGQAALQRAYQKRAKTDEYRAYQRQKQAEYRRKAKEQSKQKTTQAKLNPFPAASISKLDQVIERFEAELHDCIQQEGLPPESLPLAYRTILNALNRWQARYNRSQKTGQG